MFSSITSFISSSISSLPFRLLHEGAEVVHPSQAVAQGGGLWRHFQAVRTLPGVGGAISGAAGGGGSGGVGGGSGSAGTGGSGVGDPISVFTFDKRAASADQQALARNALQRLKTLRHPNILRYIDSVDLPTHLHILTEPVTPLTLRAIPPSDALGQLAASLGLQQVTASLSWLNNDAKLVHSNLHPGSLYTTDSGDWKLSGFDLCHKGSEALPDPVLLGRNSGILPAHYRAPELVKSASSASPPAVLHAVDAWSLGCLIYHVFHGSFQSPQQLASAPNVPPTLLADYKKLLATNPANRMNPRALLEHSPFFRNDLVDTVQFLDHLALKSAQEKDAFFIRFSTHVSDFPPEFNKHKILPLLTKSLDYGSGLTCFSSILRSVLTIGQKLTEAEMAQLVLPSVVRLFASNERAIRVHLLQHLGDYAGALSPQLINESIFSHVLTGFSDSNAILRELTVKSLLHLAPKLHAANMDLALRHLAKLQTDPEPAIRTNTCYCIAKIAPSLTPATQEKVLLPAFSKCLRDPFPPARVAGLMSFLATLELHRPADVARKLLPAVTPSLADEVKEVREAALKLLEACVGRMHAFNTQMKQQQEAALAANPNAIGSHQMQGQSAATAAQGQGDAAAAALAGTAAVLGSLGSWAVSTVRSKMSNADVNMLKGHMQPQAQAGGVAAHASTPTQSSNLTAGASNARNYGQSSTTTPVSSVPSSVLAAFSAPPASSSASASASASPSGGGFDNDNFFDDFNDDEADKANGSDDGDAAAPTIVSLSLSTKKTAGKAATAAAGSKREPKKSILAGGSSKPSILSPPAAATSAVPSSLDSWDFNIDDDPIVPSPAVAGAAGGAKLSAKATAQAQVVADFDDWGSGIAAAKPNSTRAVLKKSADPTDLLSGSMPAAAAAVPKRSAPAADPFSHLGLSAAAPSASPRSTGPLSLKAKPVIAAHSAVPSKPVAAVGAKKAAPVDDWGDFLNS